MDKLVLTDCFDLFPLIPDKSVDLIYLDPPFNTNRNFEDFNDKWESLDEYLEFMKKVIRECYRVLKSTGSFYLHCDWHASHYLKIECDKIFERKNFLNEIVWCYRGGGVPKNAFARKHDIIFLYQKINSKNRIFNKQYVPYSKASSKLIKLKGGVSIDGKKRDLKRGAHMPDWWVDINALQTWSPERIGYPTQKPEALLKRIIKISSNEGDIVLDPMVGSGTTCVIAKKLNRHYIGCDNNSKAIEITKKRLKMIDK